MNIKTKRQFNSIISIALLIVAGIATVTIVITKYFIDITKYFIDITKLLLKREDKQ